MLYAKDLFEVKDDVEAAIITGSITLILQSFFFLDTSSIEYVIIVIGNLVKNLLTE